MRTFILSLVLIMGLTPLLSGETSTFHGSSTGDYLSYFKDKTAQKVQPFISEITVNAKYNDFNEKYKFAINGFVGLADIEARLSKESYKYHAVSNIRLFSISGNKFIFSCDIVWFD